MVWNEIAAGVRPTSRLSAEQREREPTTARQAVREAVKAGAPRPRAEAAAREASSGGGFDWNKFAIGLGGVLAGMGGPQHAAVYWNRVGKMQERREEQEVVGVIKSAMASGEDPRQALMQAIQTNPELLMNTDFQGAMEGIRKLTETGKRDIRSVGNQLVEVPSEGAPQVLFEGAESAPTSVREAQAMGMDLRTAEGRAAYGMFKQGQSRAPLTNVTSITNLPAEAQKNPFVEYGLERITALDEKLANSLSIIPDMRAMKTAIEQGAYQPGTGPNVGVATPWGTIGVDVEAATIPALQLATMLGIADPQRLAETESFSMIQARLTPLLRPAGSGSASDADMQLFANAIPNLSRTREGNLKIIEYYERAAEHNEKEMRVLEEMVSDGSYTPSAYARKIRQMGLDEVWTPAERRALDQAQLPTTAPQIKASGVKPPLAR